MVTSPRLNSQTSSSAPGTEVSPPGVQPIIESLADAHRRDSTNLRPYKVIRRYQIFHHGNEKPIFSATAEIDVVPKGTSTYRIISAEGSSRGKKIVRKILDHETLSTNRNSSAEIDGFNYDFVFVRREELDGHRTYVLRIAPKRKATELLNGLIWVDEANYRIRKIEGTPNKKLSWWVKSIKITLGFGEVKGMWLHTSLDATASIRIVGKYHLTGQDVGLQTGGFSAKGEGVSTSMTGTNLLGIQNASLS